MKKIAIILATLLFAVNSFAADALDDASSFAGITIDKYSMYKHYRDYVVDITDDTGDAGYSETMSIPILGCITEVETIPVADADCTAANQPHTCCTGAATGSCSEPTDNYDIVLNTSYGLDVMDGALGNRDTANAEQATPLIGGAYKFKCNPGKLTVVITNQSVDEATIRLKIKTEE